MPATPTSFKAGFLLGRDPALSRPYLMTRRPGTPASFQMETSYARTLRLIAEREGEDAGLTGGTRSLHRRLLALNLRTPKRPAAARQSVVTPTAADVLIA